MAWKRLLSLRNAPWCVGTAAVLVLGALSGVYAAAGTAQAASPAAARPCNIYAAGHTPCVAAYSTVRALYQNYSGPLYQVTRACPAAGCGGESAVWPASGLRPLCDCERAPSARRAPSLDTRARRPGYW